MAKNYTCLLRLFCITVFIGSIIQNAYCGTVINAPSEKQILVHNIYTAEVGVKELTGHNDGKRVELFLKSCHLKKGDPWCAAFVCWSFQKAGVKTVISGYSPAWFSNSKVIYIRGKGLTPQMADVGGIWFPKMGRIAHTFFIDKWEYGTPFTVTVEGNTNKDGSREGNLCAKKRRLKTQIYKVSRWL